MKWGRFVLAASSILILLACVGTIGGLGYYILYNLQSNENLKTVGQQLADLPVLDAGLTGQYACNSEVEISNFHVLVINMINCGYLELPVTDQKMKAKEIANFAINHYGSIDTVDTIIVRLTRRANGFLRVDQYSDYIFSVDDHSLHAASPVVKIYTATDKSGATPTDIYNPRQHFYLIVKLENVNPGSVVEARWYASSVTNFYHKGALSFSDYTYHDKVPYIYFFLSPNDAPASNDGVWPTGLYRVEVYVDDARVAEHEFEVIDTSSMPHFREYGHSWSR